VSALARMGSQAAVELLGNLIADARTPRHLVDVARLAIARIDPTRAKEVALQRLPGPIKQLYSEGNSAGIAVAIERALPNDTQRTRDAIITLYMLNDAVARPAVMAAARVARLAGVEASIVRTLFRLAEVNRDGELYALLARRIDAHRSDGRPFSP